MKLRTSLWILVVWILITIGGWWLSALSINRIIFGERSWNFTFHTLFILVPLVFLLLDRSRARSYGVTLENWRPDLRLGTIMVAILFIPPLLADLLSGNLELAPSAAQRGVVSTLVFVVVFVGLGEELLYRGFFQGEFNRAWGRPYTIRGTRFGAGVLFTALLFGIAHWLNPFNPLRDRFALAWLSFAGTAPLALLLGLVRERVDGLIAVSLTHLGIVLYLRLFVVTPYSGTVTILMWIVGAVILMRCVLERDGGVPVGSEIAQ